MKKPVETKKHRLHSLRIISDKQAKRVNERGFGAESNPAEYRANRVASPEDERNAEARRALEDRLAQRELSAAEWYGL